MNRLTLLWNWVVEGRVVIMCLLVIYLAIHLGFITWHSETSIRISGYGLQLIGMIFAIRGLLSIREHFGQPLLSHLFVDWLKRFPIRKRTIHIGGNASLGSISSMKAYAEVWTPDKPENSVADRITDIVKNLDRLREVQMNTVQSIDEVKREHDEHKKDITEKTENLESSIKSDIETLHTSDIITSLVGLVWLTVGITLSTLAPELSMLVELH